MSEVTVGWRLRVLGAVILLLTATASAQQKQQPFVDVQRLMSVNEYRAAGLQKLSAEELASLNTWFGQYAMRIINAANPPTAPEAPRTGTAEAIESRIEGEFEGWSGETLFKLDNGQIWQQSSFAYTYHYAYRPSVFIYRSGLEYRLRVDGLDGYITVKRLR